MVLDVPDTQTSKFNFSVENFISERVFVRVRGCGNGIIIHYTGDGAAPGNQVTEDDTQTIRIPIGMRTTFSFSVNVEVPYEGSCNIEIRPWDVDPVPVYTRQPRLLGCHALNTLITDSKCDSAIDINRRLQSTYDDSMYYYTCLGVYTTMHKNGCLESMATEGVFNGWYA